MKNSIYILTKETETNNKIKDPCQSKPKGIKSAIRTPLL